MKTNRRIIWSLAVVVLGIVIMTAENCIGARSQSRVLPHSFQQTVTYLSHVFKTDLAERGRHSEVWGPKFLDTGTLYFTETYSYTPGELLRFQARYYQIGGENNTFTVEAVENNHTKLTVDRVVKFIFTFSNCKSGEIRILNTIEDDLKHFTDDPEQGVPGYRRQSAPQPGP